MPGAHRPHADFHSPLHLKVEGLCVERGGRMVLENIGFALAGGDALVVTGHNGVGKSTLLRTLAGLLPRVSGSVALEGAGEEELSAQSHDLAHSDGLKTPLTAMENLEFWASYLAAGHPALSLTPAAALANVGLTHVADAPVGILSAGQKRRVALARLMVAHRPLWLLDEPMTALDAASRARFANAMRDHCALGGMIVAATHEPLGVEEARELPLGAAS